jgi:hypothetical protein
MQVWCETTNLLDSGSSDIEQDQSANDRFAISRSYVRRRPPSRRVNVDFVGS